MTNPEKDKQQAEEQNKDASVKPQPETLHTTDPQDEMKGPLSSVVQSGKEAIEENKGEKGDD